MPDTHSPIDVVLVTPLIRGTVQPYFHIGVVRLASDLAKQGVRVHHVDRNALVHGHHLSEEACDRHLLETVVERRPRVVGLTCFTDYFRDVERCTAMLAEACGAGVHITAGGVHPTFEPRRTLTQIPGLDSVVRGPGLEPVMRLLDGPPYEAIPGLCWRRGEELVVNPLQTRPALKRQLDIPDYTFADTAFYFSERVPTFFNGLQIQPMAVLATSTPCPGTCAFCIGDKATVEHFAYRPGLILEEMELLVGEHGVRIFWFADRDFFYSRRRALEFCERKAGHPLLADVAWATTARPDQIDDEVASALYRSSCLAINLGIESGSNRLLELMSKQLTVEQVRRAIDVLNHQRVLVFGSFIMGMPQQTEDDIRANFDLFRSVELHDGAVLMLMPVVGSPYYRDMVDRGILNPDDPATWDEIVSFNAENEPSRNYSDVAFDVHQKLFKELASEVYNTCARRRPELIGRCGRGAYFDEL